ncbi:glycosyltransferase family 2 protein [Listeria grandensis]|uniref:glycosyltransferase family 2 protein n=1 Tax=Listeria grandensis TaxID=1494963 RepID=UPI00164E3B8E|nr:glycosyltransferase family 2 protein [Listeria grandensis]MBC6316182.1 glycosyltransferase family 2 protein [Listeria grandensis]
MKEALVSVIIPTYNSEATVLTSIHSVLNQTYQHLEIILVDDCSNDGTVALVKNLKNTRIRVYELSKNSGAATARNKGLEEVRGRFIAFLDSDDVWHPKKLALQMAFMKNKQIGFSFTSYERIVDHKNKNIVQVPSCMAYHDLLKNTIINCSTVIIDRKIVSEVRMPDLRTRQDTATWLSILKRGNHAYGLNIVLAEYNIRKDSLSAEKGKMAVQTWKMYRTQEKLSYWYAAFCFSFYAYNAIRKRVTNKR